MERRTDAGRGVTHYGTEWPLSDFVCIQLSVYACIATLCQTIIVTSKIQFSPQNEDF